MWETAVAGKLGQDFYLFQLSITLQCVFRVSQVKFPLGEARNVLASRVEMRRAGAGPFCCTARMSSPELCLAAD